MNMRYRENKMFTSHKDGYEGNVPETNHGAKQFRIQINIPLNIAAKTIP